ncbi:MAG: thiol-disulfide oxidoreductase DCC family protein [Bacteroidetes bacterium]|nr:thiol-disulfide oxidoreductase DCC [Rhodothermaceae bacterium RA]RMH52197.1 MAG: thiol-disulfide oxidoreductase DCC family protein [Bacteroidota bacterium]
MADPRKDPLDVLKEHAVILFDGVCNLCNASVNFVIDHDPAGYFKMAALQSDEAAPLLEHFGLQADYLDSIVLIEGDRVYRHSDAALRVARRLDGAWPLLYAFIVVPRPIRDAVYDWIARNRYAWFGRRESCRIPTPDVMDRFL